MKSICAAELVKVSQNANIKLRDIARRYVEAWESQAGERSQNYSEE